MHNNLCKHVLTLRSRHLILSTRIRQFEDRVKILYQGDSTSCTTQKSFVMIIDWVWKTILFFNPNVTGLCAFLSSHNFNLKFKEKTQQLPSLFGCFLNFSSIHASGPRSDCFVNRAKKKVLSHLKETGKEWRSEPARIKNIVSEMEHCCRLDTVLYEASIKIPFE